MEAWAQSDPNGIEFRLMEEGDIVTVSGLEKELFSLPWSAEGFKSALARDDALYVVSISGERIIAYCGMYLIGDEGYINQVAVEKGSQGAGIGRRTLSYLLDEAERRGMRACTLEVRVSNERAVRLYHGLGFEDAGVRPGFYDSPAEDALILWRYK